MRHFRVTVVALEKVMSITYSERVFVALVFQHAMRMRHIVICDLTNSTKNFVVAPCLSDVKHFIVQLMHINYKILRLLTLILLTWRIG